MTFVCQQAQKKLRVQIYCHRKCLASRRALKGWGLEVALQSHGTVLRLKVSLLKMWLFLVNDRCHQPSALPDTVRVSSSCWMWVRWLFLRLFQENLNSSKRTHHSVYRIPFIFYRNSSCPLFSPVLGRSTVLAYEAEMINFDIYHFGSDSFGRNCFFLSLH